MQGEVWQISGFRKPSREEYKNIRGNTIRKLRIRRKKILVLFFWIMLLGLEIFVIESRINNTFTKPIIDISGLCLVFLFFLNIIQYIKNRVVINKLRKGEVSVLPCLFLDYDTGKCNTTIWVKTIYNDVPSKGFLFPNYLFINRSPKDFKFILIKVHLGKKLSNCWYDLVIMWGYNG